MLGIYGINVIQVRVNETLVQRSFDTYIVEGQVLCNVLVVFCIKKLLLKVKCIKIGIPIEILGAFHLHELKLAMESY